VTQIPSDQLIALELQACHLVHSDWLPVNPGEFTNLAQSCPQPNTFELVLSRHLIDTHKLVPLTPELFSHDWTYCVAGGHKAMQALTGQVTSYLIATMVKSTISGEHARTLSSQLGQGVYEHSLKSGQSLRMWTAPKSSPLNAVEFFFEKSRLLVDGLWLHHSPALADWARLMSKAVSKSTGEGEAAAWKKEEMTSALPYSLALLDEINQRLQIDFSIDIGEIFASFLVNSSAPILAELPF
jgi:hypothetical protein